MVCPIEPNCMVSYKSQIIENYYQSQVSISATELLVAGRKEYGETKLTVKTLVNGKTIAITLAECNEAYYSVAE